MKYLEKKKTNLEEKDLPSPPSRTDGVKKVFQETVQRKFTLKSTENTQTV